MVVTEKQIEDNLIELLKGLRYTYRPDIRDKISLEKNFREKFEALNQVRLTDSEFARLRDEIVSADVFKAAKTLRETSTFQREDGTPLHYTLVNIKEWCKNEFEVINQLHINTYNSFQRYDVILLINGLPVVQIELKTLDLSPRKAMKQIVDYKSDPGNGYTNSLLCFMQLFIVSNLTDTCYFSNNNHKHFAFDAEEHFLPIYRWANGDNQKITHLHDFAETFLARCRLGEMISRYMVLVASEKKLMVMRPYQIYAVQAIVACIQEHRGNGYIWHTTGSGKTLTSFKASTLLKDNPEIEKCLFVVDRKDLDRQTREEFNKFQEGCVEENTNTETLVKRLLSQDYADKVIVTTIQKLGLALDSNGNPTYKERLKPLRDKRMVFIFDECHRSQFGKNHRAIKEFFPNAQLFGFTGTPIFEENSTYEQIDGTEGSYKTTTDIFQKELHNYTITHAIEDKNVLRFHIDYFKPNNSSAEAPSKVKAKSDQAQQAVVEAILDKHNIATNTRRFNALLATSSINNAIEYYELFKETQKKHLSENDSLNVACVFSPPAEGNPDIKQLQEDLPQEQADNQADPHKKKQALTRIIEDYNNQYSTNHSISKFDLYYQDVQQRIKDQKYPNSDYPHKNKVDVVIVVDMLLTGFDSKYLNTLYVDKNLKHHGLIQAFSRTNRVLNTTKPYGHILDFRKQERAVDKAITLFSGSGDKARAKKIWLVEPAKKVIEKFNVSVTKLEKFMDSQGLSFAPKEVINLKGDKARVEFIQKFKEVQSFKTQLDQYTDLNEEQKTALKERLPEESARGFRAMYLETAQRLARQNKADSTADLEGQLDFEFVLFSSSVIDYDYIMKLMAQYSNKPAKQTMTREQLKDLLRSHSNLMDEQEDIIGYINNLEAGKGLSEAEIREGYKAFRLQKYESDLKQLAQKHGIKAQALKKFVDDILDDLIFDGQELSDLLAPLDLGWKARIQKERALMKELGPLLRKGAQGRKISGLSAYE